MNPTVSSDTFDTFFAWAPWVVGVAIYLTLYFAKRREIATSKASLSRQQPSSPRPLHARNAAAAARATKWCPQDHGGAVGYKCSSCAQEALA